MKMMIKDSLRRLPGLLAGVLLLAGTAACTIEPLVSPDITGPGSGDRVALRLELGVSSSELGIRTRTATAGEELSDVFSSDAVTSLWVGVFDVETGNLVGKNNFRFDDKGGKGTATVDILYYDAHPVLRIFGVANYEDITGHDGKPDVISEPADLSVMLEKVEKMSDLFEISVDAESANQAALSTGAPLMMGVYKNKQDVNDLYTIKASSEGEVVTYATAYGNNTDLTLNDASVEHMYDRLDYAKLDGSIRLRRLLSQVNVTVEGGTGITVSNLSYRKFNMPTEVYLQERKMTGMNGSFNEWILVTPNRADALVTTNDYGDIEATPFYESDKNSTEVVNGKSFQFHQYENKHWGISDYKNTRETTRQDSPDNPVFVALCDKEGMIYNNYASYFELKMDVEDENKNQRGTVTYRIHEGYCNDENGIASSQNGSDFSCFRNTIYYYTIKVNGLNSIDVTVDTHNHNSGVVGGTLLSEGDDEVLNDEPVLFSGRLVDYVCYYENDGSPVIYGNNEASKLLSIPALASAEWMDPSAEIEFGFELGDTDVRDLFEDDGELNIDAKKVTAIDATLGQDGHFSPKRHVHVLYLLVDESTEGDPCENYKYYRYYYFPKDSRETITSDPNFKLAFANTWDNASSEDNGAVADKIKTIDFSMKDAQIRADAAPEYKVYVDGNLVYTGNELETIDLWSLCNDELKQTFTAQSKHKVNVVISDTSETYQDFDSDDIQFMVYPTKIEWNYNDWKGEIKKGAVVKGTYFFGQNTHFSDTDKYAGIRQIKDMDISQSNSCIFLQTGGGEKVEEALEITALYDAVLTVYPSSTRNDWQYKSRYLEVKDSEGSKIVQASFPSGPSAAPSYAYHFYVKKGSVTIVSGGSLNIYKMELAYLPVARVDWIWDFSTDPWNVMFDEQPDKSDVLDYSIEVDGLHFITKDSPIRFDLTSKYVDTRGMGSVEKGNRLFWFDAYKSGTVKVYAGATSSRQMAVQWGNEKRTLPETNSAARPSVPAEIHIKVEDQPTRVYVFSNSGGMYVYRIDYIEDDIEDK